MPTDDTMGDHWKGVRPGSDESRRYAFGVGFALVIKPRTVPVTRRCHHSIVPQPFSSVFLAAISWELACDY